MLSLDKLCDFAHTHHWSVHRIFAQDNRVFLVEFVSTNTTDHILVSIPSKYTFPLDSVYPTYSMFTVPLENDKVVDDVEDYSSISEALIQESYRDVSVHGHLPEKHAQKMSDHLNESYKHIIISKDVDARAKVLYKDMHRQLQRLKYCIEGLPYSIALMDSPHMALLGSKKSIIMFKVDGLKQVPLRELFICVDLEIFYDKIALIEEECAEILKGVHTVLNNNQKIHTKNVKHIMDKRTTILTQSEHLQQRKDEYTQYIQKYSDLLRDLNTFHSEKSKLLHEEQVADISTAHGDLKRIHKIQRLEKDLKKMEKTREKINTTLRELKDKNTNLTLTIDSILFDNIVMIDKIFKNFNRLDELEQQ
jgi:hypothetical protein